MQLQLLINFLDLLLKRSFILHTGTCIMSLNQAKQEAQVQRIWFKMWLQYQCSITFDAKLFIFHYLTYLYLKVNQLDNLFHNRYRYLEVNIQHTNKQTCLTYIYISCASTLKLFFFFLKAIKNQYLGDTKVLPLTPKTFSQSNIPDHQL